MKKILGFLASAKVLSVIGLLALAVVIWLIGPMIGVGAARPLESPAARGIVIMALVLAWVLNLVRLLLKANKANKGMAEGLVDAKSAGPDRSQEEVGALKQRFEQALEVLKKSKGKKGRLSLYDLPWYIIIGPPGSGKTTALVNSGLEFPLAEKYGREALSGVGGTRNCDWWFTDEAILVDTAGRYTTQDSDASVDRSAWEGFLALLKKYRRRRPINGVIVAISLLDLMTLSEHERLAHARAIKTRIQELDKFFKIRFPVYVILTKTDLVAGFMEFFDDLAKNDREQIWGATFPIDLSDSAEGAVPRFAPEFDALLERLNARLLWRMSQERDPRRRASIYGFPRQLASLRDNLRGFLADVFRGSSFEEAPMLRGVYFTSGTQEGTPIDRLMGMVARTFGLEQHVLPAQGGRGRSYFLKALLKEVVFRESEIAGTNRKFENQRAWLQKSAYVGSFAILLLLVAGWAVSYLNNRALIGEAQAATTAASQALAAPGAAGDVLALLPALEAVKKIPGVYQSGGRWLGLGLDQGARVQSRAEIAYRNMLREMLLPRLLARTEEHLRAGGSTPDFQYEALKAYLMIDSQKHYDARAVIEWFAYDYATYLAPRAAPGDRDVYLAHLNALFEQQPVPLVVLLDQNLIEQTQRIVARIPVEERVYSRLKNSGDAKALRDLALFDLAGPRAQIVFAPTTGPGIDGFFTRDGYQKFFAARSGQQAAALVDESWILGPYAPTDLDAAAVVSRAKQLYLNEFAGQYEKVFATVKLAGFSTVEEAVSVLNILSDPAGSPLLLLLKNAAEQTQLAAPPAAGAAGGAAPGDRLGGVLGGQAPAAAPAAADDTQVIDRRLGWVRERLGTDPASAPIGQVLKQLDALFQFMQGVVAARGADGQIPNTLLEPGRAVFQQVRNASSREPPVIQGVMRDAVTRSEALVFSGVRSLRNSEWRSEALPFCKRAIADHYPIKVDSDQDISPEEFGKFFGPSGLMDAFFKNYLDNYVDKSRRPWQAKPAAADSVSISADALKQFERAAAIRDTFFMAGAQVPSVSFELRPMGMSETITQFTLDLAGQTVTYSHGPVQPQSLQWPGPKPDGDVRMEMAPAAAGESLRRVSGPWAWFKILDKATTTPTDRPDSFNVEFTLGSRSATYVLKARSTNNPFQFPDLHQFACPESL
ncbi:MAG TPA: type VI secretion system membrane subunit TssM [Gammaproteobacteria bacterium]|nr:type VI secretion system membrane subunit TssM [Gammaproteobacteria bacterium]